MSTTTVEKDLESLTMSITATFEAPIERIWRLWADPRQLERWWGPPTYPATMTRHELQPGGSVEYFMTGPGGDRHAGWWRITSVEPPRRLEFEDGFADEHGNPNTSMPTILISVELAEDGGSTTMTVTSRFPSREAMEQLAAMGMEEGMLAALGQVDALLAEDSSR